MKRLHTLAEVIFIFLCSLTPLLWLRPGEIILGHDSGFRLDPFRYLRTLWYSWDHASGFGVDLNGYKGFLIGQLPEALFVRLTHSLSFGQTLCFVFLFFIIGCSMYVCVRTFFPDRKYWVMRLLSSLGYMYNLFLLQGWFITERAKFSLFAALPLVFTISWLTLRGKYSILKGSILFGWTLFLLNGGGSPPLYGGILVTLGVVVLIDIVAGFCIRQGLARIWRVTRMVVSMVFITVLINAYWVVPQLYQVLPQYGTRLSSMGGFSGIMAWESYVSTLASFSNLFRLQGIPDWYNHRLHPYSAFYNQPILIFLSFLPILSFTYVLLRRDWWREFKRSYLLLGTLIAIWFVGMILTAGSHPPAGFIYAALVRYLPGFAIFRTSFYKFGPTLWFSAILLFSLSATVILMKHIRNKILYGFAACILLIGLMLFHYPYFFTNFFLWNAPFTTKVQVPDYVTDMLSYINTTYDHQKPRILILPPLDTSYHTDGYEWGFWSLDLFTRLGLSSPTIANDHDSPIVVAMYNAIEDGNMKLFNNLAKQSGVTKLLWRDDVLYSNKKTASINFSSMKKAIDGFKEATEEKRFGKWTLYALSDFGDIEQVQVATVLVQADTPGEFKASLFALEDVQNLPILFTDNVPATDGQQLMAQWNVISAKCVYCDPSQLKKIEETKTVSKVNLLPDSPMYGLSKLKEDWVLNSFLRTPQQYIDANLGYATKHLVEISSALTRASDNTGSLAEQSFGDFQLRIATAVRTLGMLPEIKQNTYRLRLISYLRFYMNYLITLEGKDNSGLLSKRFFGNAYQYLQKQIASVSRGVWISDGAIKRYYLSIPVNGTYKLAAPRTQRAVDTLFIDGTQSNLNDTVYLKAGIHKLETLPSELENTVTINTSTASADISLPYGDSYTVNIKQMSDRDLYMFHLEYQVPMGKNIFVELHQNNDSSDQYGNSQSVLVSKLQADGKWHVAEDIVHPNIAVSSGSISFYSADTLDQSSMVSVKNLSLTNIKSGDIFALKNSVLPAAHAPTVTSEEISPIVYRVHVENAVSPYIAIFNEQYDDGWRAYILPGSTQTRDMTGIGLLRFLCRQSVPSSQHFALNGYANAWYLTKPGSYDIIILYWPQTLFLLSVGITIVSLAGSILWLFRISRKENV